MQDWLWMSAAALGRGIGAGEICPVALTKAYLDAAEAHPMRDRIYARMTRDRALAEAGAAKARAAAGQRIGPLDGVPASWKDLFDTAGTVTEAGSALLEGRVPARDAEVLRRATAQGMVCLGKTHMSELAFSGLGLNPVTATSPCVNDEAAVSGGSSSGAAASVAYGLAPIGIGSDTGGSVRIPAAWNDLVGLKTTSGRLPLTGVVPLCERFDTVGPLCRTVEDAALMFAVLAGEAPVDLRGATLKGMRFARLRTLVEDEGRDAPMAAYRSALDRLNAAGARIVDVEAPEIEEALSMAGLLYTAEAYGIWGVAIEAAPQKMFPMIRERFESGRAYAACDYVKAWRRLEVLRGEWAARMAGFDGVLMPSSPTLPPEMQRLLEDEAFYVRENLLALRNTRVGNLMGLSAVTLPTGVASCGVMICGQAGGEARLLRVAQAAEAALA